MSTRSMLDFHERQPKTDAQGKKFSARLYNHFDGYPEQRLLDIKEALDRAKGEYNKDFGFGYRAANLSGYMGELAAYYILCHKTGCGNIDIDNQLHSDIEYLYQIWPNGGSVGVTILTPDWNASGVRRKSFWDNPTLDKMRVEASGDLDELIEKYCKEETNA